jgi:hypothetical protein
MKGMRTQKGCVERQERKTDEKAMMTKMNEEGRKFLTKKKKR